jgi:hypothetical protein
LKWNDLLRVVVVEDVVVVVVVAVLGQDFGVVLVVESEVFLRLLLSFVVMSSSEVKLSSFETSFVVTSFVVTSFVVMSFVSSSSSLMILEEERRRLFARQTPVRSLQRGVGPIGKKNYIIFFYHHLVFKNI